MYIAGPSFGARQAAGNSVEDIRELCTHAHRFGCRIYVTLNTILFDDELDLAAALLKAVNEAGADAIIVQDPAVLQLGGDSMVYHASTQCAIRTPEKAAFLESLGFGRLILERQLSLEQIKAIRKATSAELEFFVHGALCMSYSGECYLSERLSGRSANRGACIQACRSIYEIFDTKGQSLGRPRAYLSLKDLMLLDNLEELAEAGTDSFKIEGRLKNSSYVSSVVAAYSKALDALVSKYPQQYRRASFGRSSAQAPQSLYKTFNRGYTQLYLHGEKGSWASLDTPKSMGEAIGLVKSVRQNAGITEIRLAPEGKDPALRNGDGFAYVRKDGGIGGFRGFRCGGLTIECRGADGLAPGMTLYRNLSMDFEKSVSAAKAVREIAVELRACFRPGEMSVSAVSEDGRSVSITRAFEADAARDAARMEETIRTQFGKRSSVYLFRPGSLEFEGPVPFLGMAFLNAARRDIAAELDSLPVNARPLNKGSKGTVSGPASLDYHANIANHISRELYASKGGTAIGSAYELSHEAGAELMRSRYCLRNELGICPRQKPGTRPEPLLLRNNGRTLTLEFHCAECEMSVR